MEDFGIIVATYQGDYSFAKGCCASVRYFLGDVPICLIVDGTFSTSSLEKAYGVRIINHNTVTNKFLREKSFGWGKTKMIAFWESPWQNFLVLDADTSVWGNILKYRDFSSFDVIIDKPRYGYTDNSVSEFFFEFKEIEQYFPSFNWKIHQNDYFCTGTFFSKRNIFPLEEYMEILDFTEMHPGVFKYGEMGFLNFMLFRAADEGRIRLGKAAMQLIVPDFEREELRDRFPVTKSAPVVQNEEAIVIHWCGKKPFLSRSQVFSSPMNFFRRKFVQDAWHQSGLTADLLLQVEDFNMYKKKLQRRLLSGLSTS